MRKTIFLATLLSILFQACSPLVNKINAQKSLLQSGPMLGYSEMKETLIWVQTKEPAKVQIKYWEKGKRAPSMLTAPQMTETSTAFTAKLIADKTEPGRIYEYELTINGQLITFDYPTSFQSQTLWQWRTDPPDFKIAVGSCSYINEEQYDRPGTPYGSNYKIFQSIYNLQPDMMLWLGDNVYLREVDWYSLNGIQNRYTHTRSVPELQPLLASTHHYAIWDDHDYGPNDSDRSYIHKNKTLETFENFWGNPTFGLPNQKGITTFFQWNDINFFLLDNRYFRTPNNRKTGKKTILGKQQIEWLIDALAASDAPFKMVAIGGQVLNSSKVYETYNNIAPLERAYLLEKIEEEGIKGVVFLTGDRHHTVLSKMINGKGNAVYDLTVSPFTAGSNAGENDSNVFQVEGTLVGQHNFGILEFSGKRESRKMTIRIFDSDGKEIWEKEISKDDL